MRNRARIVSSKRVRSAHAPSDTRDGILIRRCSIISEFEACVAVERTVWGSADIDIVPIPLFVVARETGGQVLGAFDGSHLIGFTMALAGWRERRPFLHSHMTAVLPPYRDRGIGRRLKIFQRQEALSRGITRVEWTFDPLVVKNAYVNFMRLGAIARRYLPNVYGVTSSPLHGPLPTDRLVAEWELRSPRVMRILAGKRAKPAFSKDSARIYLPPTIETLKETDPALALRAQSDVRGQFIKWFDKGYIATAVAGGASGAEYILEPSSEL